MVRMDTPDAVMARIAQGQELAVAGDREGARRIFEEVWDVLAGPGADTPDPLHVVTLAHYMADVQTDPVEELRWDLRALHAADSLTDDRARQHHSSLRVAGFYPSLHLNVAAAHHALGQTSEARQHLDRATQSCEHLTDNGYGRMIRGAVERLRAELDAEAVGPQGQSEHRAQHR
ncbi:tetratricopeptide repeat protein [Rhodococcus sp. JVH1]|uniref:tetratricopeptide repeat protein n=1 Tax=Rhodococcus sp. JVH1 TaxID=745408 RepID=UPI000271F3C4|nr:tetratricopeptide repeat protein [Rhodococcus sp. JVH1]EJI99988.1 tetratricopeptide repeat family protein [Rhodococcus sp. JVH1]